MGGSHEQQVKVNLTYEILSDPLLREQHDRYWLYRSSDSSGFRKTPDKDQENKTSLNQNLHAKVALIFETEISRLYQEKQLWITNRAGVYFLKLKNWRKEQLHAHTKLYEEYIKKLKKQKKDRADSRWYAIIGAEAFIVLLALSLFINLLGFDVFMVSLLSMSIAFVFITIGIASFSNLKWLIIDDNKLDITNSSIKNDIKQAIRKK